MLITCEERVYDQVLEFMDSKTPTENSIVHVINIDIQDNLEEATIGAFLISDMCTMVPIFHLFLYKMFQQSCTSLFVIGSFVSKELLKYYYKKVINK